MRKEFIHLEEVLKEQCGTGPVYYLANGGNWGDALIRYATIKFFRDVGIVHRELVAKRSPEWVLPAVRRGTLIYGGGGAWCQLWGGAAPLLKRIHTLFRNIVVLPSTYDGHYAVPKTTFFCRDLYASKKNMPDAIFCHDMAFYVGHITAEEGSGVGYFFRTDKESARLVALPSCNVDVSRRGQHRSPVFSFVDEIAQYRVVHTDRLHVAILSCLLGKELHFYPGAYFKNKAVYFSSITGFFANTYFHDDGEITKASEQSSGARARTGSNEEKDPTTNRGS
jgi:exopolysaccharide biosynthesis predicted pyruvyltransferase EpsI